MLGLKAESRTMIGRYAKMLLQALPGTDALSFDDFAPKASKVSSQETRRIAAAAFYHCLGKCLVCLLSCAFMMRVSQFFRQKT
jgi:hypothetical protein